MCLRSAAAVFLIGWIVISGFGISAAQTKSSLKVPANAVAERFFRTELFFGLSRKGGPDVSEAEFQAFIDEFVAPRFPRGFTVLDARGQWRENDGTTTKEKAKMFVVVYLRSERRPTDAKVEEIRNEYKKRFSQQSVLRVDMTKGVRVDF